MVNRGSVQLRLPFTLTWKGDMASQPTAVPAEASRERENQGSYLPPFPFLAPTDATDRADSWGWSEKWGHISNHSPEI